MAQQRGTQRSKRRARAPLKGATGRVTPKPSARYTPPVPRSQKVSPSWYPFMILSLLALGALVIVIDYLGLLPGGASNSYLFVGIGLIGGGFLAAIRWR